MKLKKLITKLLLGVSCAFALVLAAVGMDSKVASAAMTGAGTKSNPYVVTTIDELNTAIASTENDFNYIKLGDNITENKSVVQMATHKPFELNMSNRTITMNNSTDNIVDIRGVATIKNGSFMNTNVKASGMEGSLTMEFVYIRNEMMKGIETLNSCPVTLNHCDITARQQALNLQSRCVANDTKLMANDYIAYIFPGGSLCLDGVEYTANIPTSSFPDGYHLHGDADGNGVCDRGYEFMFTGSGTESDPYLVTSVAQLALAVDCNTQSVNYIKLNNDMEGTATVEVEITDMPAVIDLNGKTITMDDSSYAAFKFYNDSTVKNGTINGAYVYVSYPNKTVKLEDLTIENSGLSGISVNTGTAELTRCYVTSKKSGSDVFTLRVGQSGKIVANNVTLKTYGDILGKVIEGGSIQLESYSTPFTYDVPGTRVEKYDENGDLVDKYRIYHTHKDADNDCVCDWGQESYHKHWIDHTFTDNGDGTHDEQYGCCTALAADDAPHVFDQEVEEYVYLKTNWDCLTARVYYKSCVCGAKGGEEDTFVSGTPNSNFHAGEANIYEDRGDGFHKVIYDCCNAVQVNEMHMYNREVATDDYTATDATCKAAATYYKSCICGLKGEETFESGTVDVTAHTGTANKLVDNENGTHDVLYTCCDGIAQDDVACMAIDGDDTCFTAEHCACGREIKAVKTEHTYGENGTCVDCGAQKPADPNATVGGAPAAGSSEEEKKEGCKGQLVESVLPALLLALVGAFVLQKRKER